MESLAVAFSSSVRTRRLRVEAFPISRLQLGTGRSGSGSRHSPVGTVREREPMLGPGSRLRMEAFPVSLAVAFEVVVQRPIAAGFAGNQPDLGPAKRIAEAADIHA